MVGFWCRCLHCSSVCLFSLTQILSFSHLLEHKQIHPSHEEHSITDGILPTVSHCCINSFKSHRDGYGHVSDSQLPILLSKSNSKQGGLQIYLSFSSLLISFIFQISGDSSHLFGDGLAVWLTKDRTQPGPVFGNQDEFEGLGIFLDTLGLVFSICIQLHSIYLDIPTAVMTMLSQELLVFWVTVRRNTTMETMVMNKLLAHAR